MRNRLSVCVDLIEELSVLIWRRNHGSKFEVWTRGYEVIPDPGRKRAMKGRDENTPLDASR